MTALSDLLQLHLADDDWFHDAITDPNPDPVYHKPVATGSLVPLCFVTAASDNATCPKSAEGQVYSVEIGNVAAYPVYLKFYDKASLPSAGSDIILWTVMCPAGGARRVDWPTGLPFPTGIAYVVVKGIATTDDTAVAAGDAVVSIGYI